MQLQLPSHPPQHWHALSAAQSVSGADLAASSPAQLPDAAHLKLSARMRASAVRGCQIGWKVWRGCLRRPQHIQDLQDILCSGQLPMALRLSAAEQLLEVSGIVALQTELFWPDMLPVLAEQVHNSLLSCWLSACGSLHAALFRPW